MKPKTFFANDTYRILKIGFLSLSLLVIFNILFIRNTAATNSYLIFGKKIPFYEAFESSLYIEYFTIAFLSLLVISELLFFAFTFIKKREIKRKLDLCRNIPAAATSLGFAIIISAIAIGLSSASLRNSYYLSTLIVNIIIAIYYLLYNVYRFSMSLLYSRNKITLMASESKKDYSIFISTINLLVLLMISFIIFAEVNAHYSIWQHNCKTDERKIGMECYRNIPESKFNLSNYIIISYSILIIFTIATCILAFLTLKISKLQTVLSQKVIKPILYSLIVAIYVAFMIINLINANNIAIYLAYSYIMGGFIIFLPLVPRIIKNSNTQNVEINK
ncbi:hypothetical protein DA803_00925 [[Mycoplasma] phocae]|uniref:Uncharacterized protein n=1 Tax=[Mycoplasma] phocae TaxID=142651 RepID=A0A2Z5IQB5_9BACT|nr:hypothetical protein [[Mycoplasma] phocae]AXE60654.1 hypothetical protein DA803_00925 [[Mycoplasma] phocae]